MEHTEEVEEELVEEEAVEEEAEDVEEAEVEKEEVRRKEELEEEEEIVEERVYTVPLQRAWIVPRKKRTPRAVRILKEFIQRHMKPEGIVIKNEVNELIWARSIEKPPRKIRVRATKNKEGIVTLHLIEGR